MSVLINGDPVTRRRGNRGVGFDKRIRQYAPMITDLQENGYVHSRALAAELNRRAVPSPSGGQWSDASLYRMMKRALELGIQFKRRGRSEAASRRRVLRRSKDAIETQRRADFQTMSQLFLKPQVPSDAGMTAVNLATGETA
jgi:hypothetical protein